MIAYEVLVQTIADWKAGARPTAPTPPPARAAAPAPVEELSSGVVDLDDDYGVEPAADEVEYAESDEGGYEVADEAGYEVADEGYDAGPPIDDEDERV